QAARQ
ncbi:prolyl oligopeptidase, N-terminal beta-propeller domain protein, partial [Vibrio parahaemolyticus V-223/04]